MEKVVNVLFQVTKHLPSLRLICFEFWQYHPEENAKVMRGFVVHVAQHTFKLFRTLGYQQFISLLNSQLSFRRSVFSSSVITLGAAGLSIRVKSYSSHLISFEAALAIG